MSLYIKILLFLFLNVAIFPNSTRCQSMSPLEVTINKQDLHISAYFHDVEGEGRFPTLIMLQGFGANNNDVLGLGVALSKSGINVLTIINSGVSPSEGLFSFDNSVEDLEAAYTFIHDPENIAQFKIDTAKIIVGGLSFGGGIAMSDAVSHPEIKHVISIAGNDWGAYFEEYAVNSALKERVDANMNRIITSGRMKFEAGAQPAEMLSAGLDKVNPNLYLKKNAKALASKDILLIGGWDDQVVNIDRYILPLYRELQKENTAQVRIVAFQDHHGFSESREQIAEVIKEWIKITLNKTH